MPRAIDYILAIVAALLLAPLMLAIALCVAASMGSPVLFRQSRVGRRGIPFELVKFRSMTAGEADGKLLPDDMRTPPLGRILRISRLDELPELWNILRGDMAFVGPRPLLPETIAGLGQAGVLRCSVRPGLTGLAQISGNTLLQTNEKLAMDLFYVRRRSWAFDLRILLRTPFMMVRGERIDPVLLEKANACRGSGGC